MYQRLYAEEFKKLVESQNNVKQSFHKKKDKDITNVIHEFGLISGPGNKQFVFDIPEKFNHTVFNISYNDGFINNHKEYYYQHIYKDGKLIFIINNQGTDNILLKIRIEGFPESFFMITNDIKKHK